jgi:hypothetical protein
MRHNQSENARAMVGAGMQDEDEVPTLFAPTLAAARDVFVIGMHWVIADQNAEHSRPGAHCISGLSCDTPMGEPSQ